MTSSRVPFPESTYLAQIGEVAYTVAYLEWTLLGDLGRLRPDLPDALTLGALEAKSTGQIAGKIGKATAEMSDGLIKDYLLAAMSALFEASAIRNDVLHARPATRADGLRRLNRAEVVERRTTGARFWIDDEWFARATARLDELLDSVIAKRPPL